MTDKGNPRTLNLINDRVKSLVKRSSKPEAAVVKEQSKSAGQSKAFHEMPRATLHDNDEIPDAETVQWRLRAAVWGWFRR